MTKPKPWYVGLPCRKCGQRVKVSDNTGLYVQPVKGEPWAVCGSCRTQGKRGCVKRLPGWLAGAEVTELTYEVAASVFEIDGPCSPSIIAAHLGVDEADVLRCYAELQQVGVLREEE